MSSWGLGMGAFLIALMFMPFAKEAPQEATA
jgi:hypothetical protein